MKTVREDFAESIVLRSARMNLVFVLRMLFVGILRVVAGAGKVNALAGQIAEANAAFGAFQDAIRDTGRFQSPEPDRYELTIDGIFGSELPTPEEGWRRWADEQNQREQDEIIQELRRAVLRELAAELGPVDIHRRAMRAAPRWMAAAKLVSVLS